MGNQLALSSTQMPGSWPGETGTISIPTAPGEPARKKGSRANKKKKKKKKEGQQQEEAARVKARQGTVTDEPDAPSASTGFSSSSSSSSPPLLLHDSAAILRSEAPSFGPSNMAKGEKTPRASPQATTTLLPSSVKKAPAYKCPLLACAAPVDVAEPKTTACPACLIKGRITCYCCKAHLYVHVRTHFDQVCATGVVEQSADETDLNALRLKQARPYLNPGPQAPVTTIERHRQALFFAMESPEHGDYFIFDDHAPLFELDGPPAPDLVKFIRGRGKMIAAIKESENDSEGDNRKQKFRNLVARCLTFGATNMQGKMDCTDLAVATKQILMRDDILDENMMTHLICQMRQEFAFIMPQEMHSI
jgi:hypothetical protein